MKKWVFTLSHIFLFSAFAQDTGNAAAVAMTKGLSSQMQSFIVIDPKARSSDLKDTFEMLKREKTAAKVLIELSNGSTISNIVDFTMGAAGTLFIVKYNGLQGLKYQVINVEDIVTISHL